MKGPLPDFLQVQRALRRQYGFAAEGLLVRQAKPLRPRKPKGMAGSSLAIRGKATMAMGVKAAEHAKGAAEVSATGWGLALVDSWCL